MELVSIEVRPENICKIVFRIGRLPKQEIGDSLLPTGPDNQIRVRHPGGKEIIAEPGFCQMVGISLSGGAVQREGFGRPHQLIPPAVIQADIDLHALIVSGDLPGLLT